MTRDQEYFAGEAAPNIGPPSSSNPVEAFTSYGTYTSQQSRMLMHVIDRRIEVERALAFFERSPRTLATRFKSIQRVYSWRLRVFGSLGKEESGRVEFFRRRGLVWKMRGLRGLCVFEEHLPFFVTSALLRLYDHLFFEIATAWFQVYPRR